MKDRAAIFMAAMNGDMTGALKYKQHVQNAPALQRAQLEAAGLLQPIPGAMREAPVANAGGEDISAAFGPQMEQGPSRRRAPAEIAAELARLTGSTPGFDPAPFRELAQFGSPEIAFERGFGYDKKTGLPTGAFMPDLGRGVMPAPGGGAAVIPGFANAAAGIAGAEAGAQEEAKAGWDLVEVPMADGTTVKLPRAVAAPMLAKQFTGGPAPAGFGRTQSPGDRVREEGAARTEVEQEAALQAKVAGAAGQLEALDNMESLLPDVIAGFGAGPRIQAARALAAAGNEQASKEVAATETFLNQGRVLVASIIKSFGSNPTEGERAFAERMSGADAELNPATLKEAIRLQRARIYREMREAGRATPAHPPGQRKPNTVYDTPRGPMKWTGTGWLPTQ